MLKKLIEAFEKKQFQEQQSINGSNFLKSGSLIVEIVKDGRPKIELMAGKVNSNRHIKNDTKFFMAKTIT